MAVISIAWVLFRAVRCGWPGGARHTGNDLYPGHTLGALRFRSTPTGAGEYTTLPVALQPSDVASVPAFIRETTENVSANLGYILGVWEQWRNNSDALVPSVNWVVPAPAVCTWAR